VKVRGDSHDCCDLQLIWYIFATVSGQETKHERVEGCPDVRLRPDFSISRFLYRGSPAGGVPWCYRCIHLGEHTEGVYLDAPIGSYRLGRMLRLVEFPV